MGTVMCIHRFVSTMAPRYGFCPEAAAWHTYHDPTGISWMEYPLGHPPGPALALGLPWGCLGTVLGMI